MRNVGSSSVPLTGMSRLMTPSASFNSDVANFTGSVASPFVAVASPHSSWSMRTLVLCR